MYAVATVKFVSQRNKDPEEQLDRLLKFLKSSVYEGKTKFNPNKTLDSLYMSVRVRLPWVVYSHPNSRESISTRGDIRR